MAELLGDTGFSLRYKNSYGVVEQAYIEDTEHLNFPYGVWAGGNEIWIADTVGNRALRFSSTGSFLQQIGRAGFPNNAEGISLEWVADVGVDSQGNIWLVDKSAHYLVIYDSAGQLAGTWGEPWVSGTDNEHFKGPESVAFDSDGNVYVSDTNNHRIQVFAPTGEWIQTYGVTNQPGTGDQYFRNPAHITVDETDFLYVADSGNHRVQIFDVTDPVTITMVATLGISGVPGDDNDHFNIPTGVFVDSGRIYVSDQGNSRIQVFDRATLNYLDTLQDAGNGPAQFLSPTDVAVDGAGNIYVVDQSNTRVQQYNAAFQYVHTYGVTGVPYLTDMQHFNRPAGVAVASDQSLYIVENYGNRLLKLNPDGSLDWSIGEAGVPGSDVGHFNRPADVVLDADENVYVVDRNNHRVQVFDSNGVYQGTLGNGPGSGDGQLQFPRGIAIAPDRTIYIADTLNHRIEIFDSSFNWIGRLGQTGVPGAGDDQFFEPFDVDVDSN
jgi:streptogramin lyase